MATVIKIWYGERVDIVIHNGMIRQALSIKARVIKYTPTGLIGELFREQGTRLLKFMRHSVRLQALSGTHIETRNAIVRRESTKWTLHGQAILKCQKIRDMT